MTKTKSTKRALLMSALALVMCFSMLIGSTYAWFTDSVTVSGNKIVAGTLEVDLLMGTAKDTYTSIADKEAAIFGANSLVAQNNPADTLWEPGKTQIVYLGVENKGNLDLKYNIALKVIDGGLIGSLEYAIVDGVKYGDLDTYTDWATLKAGAQTGDVVAGTTVAAPYGAIKADEDIEYFALAVHMKEEAGNDYQGKDITIDVTVLATQLASEEDSFNNQYDANAPKTEVATAADLQKVLNEGGYAVMTADIASEGNKRFDIPENTYAVLDLNGYTLTSKDGGNDDTMAIYINEGAVLTLNDSKGDGKIVSSCYGVYVKQNAHFIMNGGTISVSGNGAYDYGVNVWNSSFVMNAGTIEARFGVVTSNHYKDQGDTETLCSVTIAEGCTINATGWDEYGEEYAHLDVLQIDRATDTILDIPANIIPFKGFN